MERYIEHVFANGQMIQQVNERVALQAVMAPAAAERETVAADWPRISETLNHSALVPLRSTNRGEDRYGGPQ